MKLETIILGGVEYYQWVVLGLVNTVGDIFSDWRDIPTERVKLREQMGI